MKGQILPLGIRKNMKMLSKYSVWEGAVLLRKGREDKGKCKCQAKEHEKQERSLRFQQKRMAYITMGEAAALEMTGYLGE